MPVTPPTENAIPARRPFWQFYLSTVVLLVLTAGTMMYVHLAPPTVSSEISSTWTTTNGLSMRISLDPSVISINEQRAVIAEFRNDSNANIVIEKENGLGASIQLFSSSSRAVENDLQMIHGIPPEPPTLEKYVVLHPGQSVQRHVYISLQERNGQTNLVQFCNQYQVTTGTYWFRCQCHEYDPERLWSAKESKWVAAADVLDGKLWPGEITSEPLAISILAPRTWRSIAIAVAETIAALAVAGFISELLIRRKATH
jgi:hypothetical protein